ncbi:MAG: DUF3052 family protein [Pyrinomonadaceae bacterium]
MIRRPFLDVSEVARLDVPAQRQRISTGYSGTPLAKKLGFKSGFVVLLVNAPDNYMELVAPLSNRVRIVGLPDSRPLAQDEIGKGFDLIHLFTNTRDELFREVSESLRQLKQDGSIWVSWYKKAAKLPTEVTEDTIREIAFPLGLVDVKVCAVDDKWSGLKLVIRKENRTL